MRKGRFLKFFNSSIVIAKTSITIARLLCIPLCFSVVAQADDFKINVPASWKRISSDDQDAIFENTQSKRHERVTIQSFNRIKHNDQFQKSLNDKKQELSEIRGQFMRPFGIGNYAVLDIQTQRLQRSSFKEMQIVQARYLDLKGREVQSLERQYVNAQKMFVVTYLIDAPALNDHHAADVALDFFTPVNSAARMPAGLEDPETIGGARAQVSTPEQNDAVEKDWTSPDAGVLWGDPNKPLVKDYAALRQHCIADGIPEDKVVSPDEKGWSQGTLDSASGCLDGAWGAIKGMVTGIGSLAKGAWSLTKSAFGSYLKYFSDPAYFTKANEKILAAPDQVRAAVGPIVSEIIKDPQSFKNRMRDTLGAVLWKTAGEPYLCFNLKARFDMLCSLGTNFLPVGLLVKLIMKIPLNAEELAQVAAAGKKAFAYAMKGKSSQDAVGVAADQITKGVDEAKSIQTMNDGSRVHEFDNGISVRVSDQPKAEVVKSSSIKEKPFSLDARTVASEPALLEIKIAYGDLLKLTDEDPEVVSSLISKLEAKGMSREKIREKIKRAETQCSVR
jgi:hypothetical protein